MSEPGRDKPLVTISLFLFGKPAWEIQKLEGGQVDLELLDAIAACGQEISSRLARAAELGRKLLATGWEGNGLLYAVEFYKETTVQVAEEELRGFGIEPYEVSMKVERDES